MKLAYKTDGHKMQLIKKSVLLVEETWEAFMAPGSHVG
jgi:hypothetical protein